MNRIHQCIDIKMLAERLNMDHEAAEKWIANLILNARLNAKIDSQSGMARAAGTGGAGRPGESGAWEAGAGEAWTGEAGAGLG